MNVNEGMITNKISKLLSLSIGIILATVAYYTLFKKNNIYHGPDSNIIKTKVYKDSTRHHKTLPFCKNNGKKTDKNHCYKLVPEIYICPLEMHKNNSILSQ